MDVIKIKVPGIAVRIRINRLIIKITPQGIRL